MIEFIPVTTENLELVQTLANEIWHEHFPGIITHEQIDRMLAVMYGTHKILEELEEGRKWEIICLEDTPVGYVSYGMNNEKECMLHKIYLYKEKRGQGIGSAILTRVRDYAADNGASSLFLHVNRRNSGAVTAYKKFGFKVAREIDRPFLDFILDDYEMIYTI